MVALYLFFCLKSKGQVSLYMVFLLTAQFIYILGCFSPPIQVFIKYEIAKNPICLFLHATCHQVHSIATRYIALPPEQIVCT